MAYSVRVSGVRGDWLFAPQGLESAYDDQGAAVSAAVSVCHRLGALRLAGRVEVQDRAGSVIYRGDFGGAPAA